MSTRARRRTRPARATMDAVPRMMSMLCAPCVAVSLLSLLLPFISGHAAVTIPSPRNAIDADLWPWNSTVPSPLPFGEKTDRAQFWCASPSASAAGGSSLLNLTGQSGQACYWFSCVHFPQFSPTWPFLQRRRPGPDVPCCSFAGMDARSAARNVTGTHADLSPNSFMWAHSRTTGTCGPFQASSPIQATHNPTSLATPHPSPLVAVGNRSAQKLREDQALSRRQSASHIYAPSTSMHHAEA
eukprot:COSAG02_NODE_689_length_18462_cov_36.417470_4_plen_242_part_00